MTGQVLFYGVPAFARDCVTRHWRMPDFEPAFADDASLAGHAPHALVFFGGSEINTISMERLGFVQLLTAGSDYVVFDLFRRHHIVVASHGGANAVAVAEHTLLLILGLLRRLDDLSASIRAGRWRADIPIDGIRELRGRRFGVLGLGTIGGRVAALAEAFGAEIAYCDIEPKDSPYRPLDLDALCAWSEILSIHVPLTSLTRGMIDAGRIASLPHGAYLVNTARGAIVEESAVLDALRRGRLAGAALDVFADEPPETSRFADVPNLLLTPHRAGASRENWGSRLGVALNNLDLWRVGAEPRHRLA